MDVEIDERKGMEQVKDQFEAITQLAAGDFNGSLSFGLRMNHYATVYNYATGQGMICEVDQNYTRHETLYIDFQEMLTRFMLRFVADSRYGDGELLVKIVKWWRHYKVIQRWATKTFDYLSRFYVTHWAKMPLRQVAMSIFLKQLFEKYETTVRSSIFDAIRKERLGEITDREVVQSAIEMYSAMGIDGLNSVYTDNFFKLFIDVTSDFYRKESAGWGLTDSAAEYLLKAEKRLIEEKGRCLKYFSMEEGKRVMESVEAALLESEVARRVLFHSESGFVAILEHRDADNLKRFYKMFAHVPTGLDSMAAVLKDRVIKEGTAKAQLHSGNERDINCKECIGDLVGLHEDLMSIVQLCFCSNPVMMKGLRDGLEKVFNNGIVAKDASGRSTVVSFSELLANYLDMILRQPPGDEQVVEVAFDQVVSILRYVTDSDFFQQQARELLAKRLLSSTSKTDVNLERVLLMKLKQRCGAHFTTQFEGMMNDCVSSVDTCNQFQNSCGADVLPFEFHCMVLKTGIWPKFASEEGVRPPDDFLPVMERFAQFHSSVATHRVLKWSHATSHVTIVGRFKANTKEFQATAFQSWVLLLFNTSPSITVGVIMDTLGIDLDEVKRILMSLGKLRLAVRSADGAGALQRNDTFTLNADFTSPHRKIIIPVAVPRITVANSVKAAMQVDEDRKPTIDASLVRIMKSRREMGHGELVNECIAQLAPRFAPDPKLIKLRIEDLIKREYMERLADNTSAYRYLA